jgi:glucose-fructose oxidoreductase
MNSKPTSQKKVRYAVVGLGHLAQVAVIPAFKNAENSELVALVTGDPGKQKELSQKYGIDLVYSYDQYDECLKHVDAVYLVVPNHLHREYTVRAANAGVHILCEKPMAVTVEDCEAMIEAAETNHVKLMIAYRLHFEEGNLEAVHLAESGALGNLRIFTSSFAQQVAADNIRVTEKVENGGGPVYDIGVYCINAARYLFRDEPTQVFATTANSGEPRFKNTEEMTTVVMRFPKERLATFVCSFGAAAISRYTLIGTKGLVTADPAYEYAEAIKLKITIDEKTTEREFPKRDQFAPELIYFSDCVLNNNEPEPSGLEGLADVRIVEAIYQSARNGRFVQLPAFRKELRPSLLQQIYRPAQEPPKPVNAASPSGEAA